MPQSSGQEGMAIPMRLWRIYVQVWLVSLLFPVLSLLQNRQRGVDLLIPVAGLVLFVLFYIWSMRPHPIRDEPARGSHSSLRLLAIFVVTLLVLGLSAAYGIAFLWLLVGTSAVAGKTLPTRPAHLATALLPLLCLAAGVALSGGVAHTNWLHLIPLAMLVRALGIDMIGLSLLASTIRELHGAREEQARRAVVEERLRLARDLHDLLGHTLSLIVLKSELAGRLLEKAPDRSKSEIYELEKVARRALRQVRQAVAGYRQPTLASELDGARQMLDAAGIAYSIQNSMGILPSEVDSTLAWIVREGVTNVIRHSRATKCKIQITMANGTVRATVLNDGYIGQSSEPVPFGSGLTGLAERLAKTSGDVEAAIQAGPLPVED
ncbi:MAG TPA: histidine kinase, partial [Candidatus Binatia bacterium]|nr:histidine kinase [Candidatus Binatia bacterium]